MSDIDMDACEEAYEGWKAVQDLESMSIKDTYECGFLHGYEAAQSTLERQNAELLAALKLIAEQKREGDIPQQVVRMQRIAREAIRRVEG